MNKSLRNLEISDIAFLVAISVVILWVSYMAAAYLYARSHLIPHGVLLVSCFLLLESLVAACYSLLQKLGLAFVKKSKKAVVPAPSTETEQQLQERLAGIVEQREGKVIELTEEFKKRRKDVIRDYIYWAMAPLLEKEELFALWIEYGEWLDRPLYKPKGRNWKWKKGVVVKHIDVRHLTWNIARRMGLGVDADCNYNTANCGSFIKLLFPDLCKNVRDTTLSQCLNADADEGNIKIDIPDDDDPIAFHYPNPSEQQEEKK